MLFAAERAALNVAQEEARSFFDQTGTRPKVLSPQNVSTFFGEFRYAIRLVFEEKEILFFAALQWVVIGLAYVIWTQMIDWIPDSIWEEVRRSEYSEIPSILISLAMLAWSFFVVAVASYPISILNAAMTAAHYLRGSGQRSTIARCLNLAFKNVGRLWVFTTIDAWITVNAIFDRLPRKRGRRTALDELLYYAWKIGTIGVLPSLVAGKGYAEAAKDSIRLLKESPLRAIGIRMGYSLVCWIIGLAAYGGGVYFMMAFHDTSSTVNEFYRFYLLLALPVFIAAGVTAVVIRPFYMIMVSKLYTDIIPISREASTPTASGPQFDTLALVFSGMLCVLLALYFFGDQLGMRTFIETLADKGF